MGPRGFRRGRRRGLLVGAAVGSAAARRNSDDVSQDQPADTNDTISQLERLAQLRDQGVLTDEEFQAKKQEILAG
jgi:hypothetical protein